MGKKGGRIFYDGGVFVGHPKAKMVVKSFNALQDRAEKVKNKKEGGEKLQDVQNIRRRLDVLFRTLHEIQWDKFQVIKKLRSECEGLEQNDSNRKDKELKIEELNNYRFYDLSINKFTVFGPSLYVLKKEAQRGVEKNGEIRTTEEALAEAHKAQKNNVKTKKHGINGRKIIMLKERLRIIKEDREVEKPDEITFIEEMVAILKKKPGDVNLQDVKNMMRGFDVSLERGYEREWDIVEAIKKLTSECEGLEQNDSNRKDKELQIEELNKSKELLREELNKYMVSGHSAYVWKKKLLIEVEKNREKRTIIESIAKLNKVQKYHLKNENGSKWGICNQEINTLAERLMIVTEDQSKDPLKSPSQDSSFLLLLLGYVGYIEESWEFLEENIINVHSRERQGLFLSDNYKIILIFLISFSLAFLLLFLSYCLSFDQSKYEDKNLSYECGFDPFNESRNGFDIHYYLVAILFIIFDLEIMFLFPGVYNFSFNFDSLACTIGFGGFEFRFQYGPSENESYYDFLKQRVIRIREILIVIPHVDIYVYIDKFKFDPRHAYWTLTYIYVCLFVLENIRLIKEKEKVEGEFVLVSLLFIVFLIFGVDIYRWLTTLEITTQGVGGSLNGLAMLLVFYNTIFVVYSFVFILILGLFFEGKKNGLDY